MNSNLRWQLTLAGVLGAWFLFSLVACQDRTPTSGPLPHEGFQAHLTTPPPPAAIKTDAIFKPTVVIKNNSPVRWPSQPGPEGARNQIRLAYQWYDLQGRVLPVETVRTDLPYDLNPGEQTEVSLKIIPPEKPGEYILEIDMVQEGVGWFKNPRSPALTFKIKVE